MRNKLVLLLLFFFISLTYASASLSFSEIMYDPEGADTGREWVEIRNDGDVINLSAYKFFENNTNHTLNLVRGSPNLLGGEYAVIADNPTKFLEEYPKYAGTLFDSTFSLSNAGEFIAIKDSSGTVLDSLTYSPSNGGADDSTTLSLISTLWARGDATPGIENIISTKTVVTKAATTVTAPSVAPSSDLTLFLPEEKIVIAGADTEFSVVAETSAGILPTGLTYDWSFGDGGMRFGKSVSYHYAEPGIYLTLVDVSNGSTLFAKNRMKVRAVDPNVVITSINKSDEKINIVVNNPSSYELDIGSWKIINTNLAYILPKNTVLLPKSSTTINGLEIGMSTSTFALATTSLVFPGGKILASSTYLFSKNNVVENNSMEKKDSIFFLKNQKTSIKNNNTSIDLDKKVIKSTEDSLKVKVVSTSTISQKALFYNDKKDRKIANFILGLWPF